MYNHYNSSSNALKYYPKYKNRDPVRIKHNATQPENKLLKAIMVGLSFGFMLFCFYIVIQYVSIQAQSLEQSKTIQNLQSQLLELKQSNDNIEQRIISEVNMNDIYNIATKELGMVHPKNKDFVFYQSFEHEFVYQYKEIE